VDRTDGIVVEEPGRERRGRRLRALDAERERLEAPVE
jgi:hypothetical protein